MLSLVAAKCQNINAPIEVIHSHDILLQLGKPKKMKKIKDWSLHVVRHFWHCSSSCRKDENTSDDEALRVMKIFILTK